MHEELILDYYKRNIDQYRSVGHAEKFNPERWIAKHAAVDQAFAEYVQFLLIHNQADLLSLQEAQALARNFYYECIVKHGVVLDELCKENMPLKELFFDALYEIGCLEDEYCNTDRTMLDLTIDLILRPDFVCSKFRELKKCEWDYICVAELSKHRAMSDYLLRCLILDCKPGWINRIIDSLAFLADKRLSVSIEKYLNPEYPFEGGENINILNEEIQCAAIRYVRDVGLDNGIELLKTAEKKLYDRNRPVLAVAIEKLRGGESDLLKLYQSTEDLDVKMETLDCYELYRTREFAQLLAEGLKDEHSLENGYYPLRSLALDTLQRESFENLVQWFGPEILNAFGETVIEE